MPSWAGSLERFLAEFVHGRGLGILHPNVNGRVSFARRVPSEGVGEADATGARLEEEERGVSMVTQVEPTSAPSLRGGEEREMQETLVETHKDAMKALVSALIGCQLRLAWYRE